MKWSDCKIIVHYCGIVVLIDSMPPGKQLDNKLARGLNINDPLYQMQRDAFTIGMEALTNFRKIGEGMYVCALFMYVPFHVYLICGTLFKR